VRLPIRVLMFGWEFPPHISGGLGTACYGLSKSLSRQEVQVLFVVPRAYGDEDSQSIAILNASEVVVPVSKSMARRLPPKERAGGKIASGILTIPVPAAISPYMAPSHDLYLQPELNRWNYTLAEEATELEETIKGKRYTFSGTYGSHLMEEIKRYAEVAREIASQYEFDVIHAHDWLTYACGVEAKRISGKPLVVHMHATEYDRAGENIDKRVFKIEKDGMVRADKVITVSNWTKHILVERYGISENKIVVVYNGVMPKKKTNRAFSLPPIHKPVVTFLGRITRQKGPQYFIDAAQQVLMKVKDAHFVMAGSGDMLPAMIERVAKLRLSSRFHFTGFLKGDQVDRIWQLTNVYVMPSISEPFGISPLEAAQAGVPVIISKQSGVAEVLKNSIKVDFWNIKALANAITRLLTRKQMANRLKENSGKEIRKITWGQAARKVRAVYVSLLQEQKLEEMGKKSVRK
jgi:glycogen synthase